MSIYLINEKLRKLPMLAGGSPYAVQLDAIISETHEFSNELPEHPTEVGYSLTDAIIRKPISLTIECAVSTTPIKDVTKPLLDPSKSRADNAYNNLLKMSQSATTISVVTGVKIYRSMGIESISIPRSADDGKTLNFTVNLKQIRIVSSRTTSITKDVPVVGVSGDPEVQQSLFKAKRIRDVTVSVPNEGRAEGSRFSIFGKSGSTEEQILVPKVIYDRRFAPVGSTLPSDTATQTKAKTTTENLKNANKAKMESLNGK